MKAYQVKSTYSAWIHSLNGSGMASNGLDTKIFFCRSAAEKRCLFFLESAQSFYASNYHYYEISPAAVDSSFSILELDLS